MVAHNNNRDKLDSSKFGALPLGRDIPNQKSDDLEVLVDLNNADSKRDDDDHHHQDDDDKDDAKGGLRKAAPFAARLDDRSYAPLRLRGGGESSLSTGTSGWGTPPSQQANNNNANKASANGQQPPATSQANGTAGWGQPGGKPPAGPPAASAAAGAGTNAGTAATTNNNGPANNNGTATNTTKQQLEQLNNMREAIFSQDGWGGQHVNQDTNWDIPSSPEPPMKIDGGGGGGGGGGGPQQPWKPAVNNGTELWEANLRNGGQPPPQPQQKTPWGHTPSTNIGGTWGEDDDAADSSNVWTGVPGNQQQWGNGGGGAIWGGITGRLNGAGAEFWGQAGPHGGPAGLHHHPGGPAAAAKMAGVGPGGGGGWEEPSPPAQRRNVPNYDDGTSLWGNPQPGSHWKDLPPGPGGMGRGGGGPPGMPPSRAGLKPDGGGGAWGGGRGGWGDEVGGPAGWGDADPGWPKPKAAGGGPLWGDGGGVLEWAHKPGKQPLTKEMVWNSKQFRMLVDMGHKKEDVETALRQRDMNYEEALEMLQMMRRGGVGIDTWPGDRHDDHYDHPPFVGRGGGGFPPAVPNPLPYPSNNMLGMGSAAANGSLINNISPAIVQKMLTQGGGGGGGQGFGGVPVGRSMQPQAQPSTQQLRMLVQQIQMAVQAGYLNHQILNQPLAPQTLVLLNQLLQQIKTLQQLGSQQSIAQSQCINGKPNSTLMQCSVLITKTKQQISNLQNQIAAQQAIYVKQQQNTMGGGDFVSYKSNPMHDSINALQNNFADLAINKDPQVRFPQNQQQSRLNQWINKDKEEGGEFSRAPGSSSKPMTSSPNMNPLGLTQPDGPWSSGRTGDTGWPDSSGGDSSNDVKDAQWSAPTQPSLTDLVPEFEPGKPWKGNQIKSIEDDPSITPGSVVRSPLSVATIKADSELFSMNPSKSPPASDGIQSLGLTSSTWSFNPPSSTTSAFVSPQTKLPTSKGGLDLNSTTAVTSELWGAPKSRGPPPGLPAKGGSLANGWTNLGGVPWGGGSAGAGQRSSGSWGGSQWLLLRNLTAQIDGSTLRTLCMQHGPLINFHLYLHQGFALAKYSTREEATKAQTALNNCVLGNTTIHAENPSDWDASALLQNVANQQGSSGGWRGGAGKQAAADTWSTGWPNNPTVPGLWASAAPMETDAARATPSSLNSFLPNDLLGGESM